MEQLFDAIVSLISNAGPIGIALGFAVFAIWWIGSGRGRVGTLVDKQRAEDVEHLREVQRERDDWKALAQGATPELKRLNDLLDAVVKLLGRTPPDR